MIDEEQALAAEIKEYNKDPYKWIVKAQRDDQLVPFIDKLLDAYHDLQDRVREVLNHG